MTPIDNERIAFYYRHHNDIRKWAAIHSDIPAHLHRSLLDLAPRFRDLANELQVHPAPLDQDTANPKLFLARARWTTSERPRLAIGLEWRRSRVDLIEQHPYAGVWVDMRADGGKELYDALVETLAQTRRAEGYRADTWWPAWTIVPPDEGDRFWEDPTRYADKVVETVRRIWWTCADIMDATLARI